MNSKVQNYQLKWTILFYFHWNISTALKEWLVFFPSPMAQFFLFFFRDGVKRSPTFCILNTVLQRIDLDREVNIFQATRQVAELRPQIISTQVSRNTPKTSVK